MKKTVYRTLTGVSLLYGACMLEAATYYVSPSGQDGNRGTSPAEAWKTLARVNWAPLGAGDSILLQGGATFYGLLYFGDNVRGTSTAPIRVAAYGTGRPTINGGNQSAIRIYNTSGIRISGLQLKGNGASSNTTDGISIYNDLPGGVQLPFIRLENLDISGFGKDGVSIGGQGASGFSNVRIEKVASHDNAYSGINVWAYPISGFAHRSIYIGDSTVFSNRGSAQFYGHSGHGIIVSATDGGVIERCVAYQNGGVNTGNEGPVGIWAWAANDIVMQYNESHTNRTGSLTDGGGFDFDGGVTNSLMQYNYSHDNDGPGFLLASYTGASISSGNTIRYNISENDARKNGVGSIHVFSDSPVRDCYIYNNTVYATSASDGRNRGLYVQRPTTNLVISNNIFSVQSSVPMIEVASNQTQLKVLANSYYAGGGPVRVLWSGSIFNGLAAWRTATSQERWNDFSTGCECDPALKSPGRISGSGPVTPRALLTGYQLRNSSPLRDAGVSLQYLFGISLGVTDFFGSGTPQGSSSDIGAAELQSP